MKSALRITGLAGALAFGALFLFVFSNSKTFENSARAFAQNHVERTLLKPEDAARIEGFFETFLRQEIPQEKIDVAREILIAHFRDLAVAAISSTCSNDCRPGSAVRAITVLGMLTNIDDVARIEQAKEKLSEIVNDRYSDVIEGLRRDVMIFTGVNATLFLLILSISYLKSNVDKLLIVPAMLLLGTVAISSLVFIFGTNWFYAVVYNDFVGYGYLVYVGISLGFLIDIVFARAIVTQLILALVGAAVSSIC